MKIDDGGGIKKKVTVIIKKWLIGRNVELLRAKELVDPYEVFVKKVD